LISFFKKSLTEYQNGSLYDTYYAPAVYKAFTFAPFLYGARLDKGEFDVSKRRMDLLWSTGDLAAGVDFYNAFHQQMRKDFLLPDGNTMRLQKIHLEHEQRVTSDIIVVRFLSPLCVRSHDKITNKDLYLSIERDGFHEVCKEIVLNQIKGFLLEQTLESFDIHPIEAKKTIVPYHGGKLETSLGTFRLEGHPELLTFLYQSGIGSRRSSGFGCFDILTQREVI
jgi:CRISPR-associated endoribonuclease Cas6